MAIEILLQHMFFQILLHVQRQQRVAATHKKNFLMDLRVRSCGGVIIVVVVVDFL